MKAATSQIRNVIRKIIKEEIQRSPFYEEELHGVHANCFECGAPEGNHTGDCHQRYITADSGHEDHDKVCHLCGGEMRYSETKDMSYCLDCRHYQGDRL